MPLPLLLPGFFWFNFLFLFIVSNPFLLRWPCNRCRLRVEDVFQRESPQRSIQSGRRSEPTAQWRRLDHHDQQGDTAAPAVRNEPCYVHRGQKSNCSRCWYFQLQRLWIFGTISSVFRRTLNRWWLRKCCSVIESFDKNISIHSIYINITWYRFLHWEFGSNSDAETSVSLSAYYSEFYWHAPFPPQGTGAASFDEFGNSKYQNRRTMSSSDRAMLNAFKEISTMADRINLPRNIIVSLKKQTTEIWICDVFLEGLS